jgi:hypothetical protein
MKELVDNALDAVPTSLLQPSANTWIVRDDGSGLDPATIPRLFSINGPSSAQSYRGLPLGKLGNGLRVVTGAVGAFAGSLAVETRGHRLTLTLCDQTGRAHVVSDELVPIGVGVKAQTGFCQGRSAQRCRFISE